MKKIFVLFFVLTLLTCFCACGGSSSSAANPDSAESSAKTTFNIVYDGNGNTEGKVPSDSTVYKTGDTVTVYGNTGNLKNTSVHAVAFAGWNTKADGTGTTYTEGKTFAVSSSDVTLYADWGAWTRLTGTSGNTYTRSMGICADSSGNTYITGYTDVSIDEAKLTGVQDAFLIKYNTCGEKQWTKMSGVSGSYTRGNRICTDSEGNIYITGWTKGALDGETLNCGTDGDYSDAFVIKYDKDGNKIWTRLSGIADALTEGAAICTDAEQNIYITGYTNGDLDGETLSGTSNAFVKKYTKYGERSWTKLLGIWNAHTSGAGIAVDAASDSLYIAGCTDKKYTNADLDGTNGFFELDDAFITKFKMSTGETQWTTLLGSSEIGTDGFFSEYYIGTGADDIAVDSGGNIFICGSTTALLDGTAVNGFPDSFAAKYNSSGEKQWVRESGVWGAEVRGGGLALDSGGNVYICGDIDGPLDGQILNGGEDTFVIKFDTNGNKQWTKLMGIVSTKSFPGGQNIARGQDIAIDSNNKIYVTGYTDGNLGGESLTGYYDAFVTTWFTE